MMTPNLASNVRNWCPCMRVNSTQLNSTQLVIWPPPVSTVRTRKRSAEPFRHGRSTTGAPCKERRAQQLSKRCRREPLFFFFPAGGPRPSGPESPITRRQAAESTLRPGKLLCSVANMRAVLRNTALHAAPHNYCLVCYALARSISGSSLHVCTPYPAARWMRCRLRRTQVPSTNMSTPRASLKSGVNGAKQRVQRPQAG